MPHATCNLWEGSQEVRKCGMPLAVRTRIAMLLTLQLVIPILFCFCTALFGTDDDKRSGELPCLDVPQRHDLTLEDDFNTTVTTSFVFF